MRTTSLSAVVILASAARAQPQRTHTITQDDYFTIGVITGVAASPDGRCIAYTESR